MSRQFTTIIGTFLFPPSTRKRNKGFTRKKYFCNLAAHVSDVWPPSTTYIWGCQAKLADFLGKKMMFMVQTWAETDPLNNHTLLQRKYSRGWLGILQQGDIWAVTKRICHHHSWLVGRSNHKIWHADLLCSPLLFNIHPSCGTPHSQTHFFPHQSKFVELERTCHGVRETGIVKFVVLQARMNPSVCKIIAISPSHYFSQQITSR